MGINPRSVIKIEDVFFDQQAPTRAWMVWEGRLEFNNVVEVSGAATGATRAVRFPSKREAKHNDFIVAPIIVKDRVQRARDSVGRREPELVRLKIARPR